MLRSAHGARITPSTQTSSSQGLRSLIYGSLNCHHLADVTGISNEGVPAVPPTADLPYSQERLVRFSGGTPLPLGSSRLLPTLQ